MQCLVRKLRTQDKNIKNKNIFGRLLYLPIVTVRSERVLAYPVTSVPLTLAHIDGLKMSTDTSTLFCKLKMRIITDAPRNIDVCIVDRMFLVQSNVDLPSIFGGQANVTLSCLVRQANYVGFACVAYKYPSNNDITREDHGLL